jgi:hypothetical protein
MATQEFYIRSATETDARGPFNQEQLASLAEAGQVDGSTLYYEATTEQWVAVGDNAPLMATLFPEKKPLKIKPKESVSTLNVQREDAKPIEVNDMLAAAEGRTADTKDKSDPMESYARAAKVGMYAATLALALSAVGLLLPSIDVIASGEYTKLLLQPFALLGALDLLLFLLLVLQTVAIYPFLRFRAALGFGFVGFYFWTQSESTLVLALAAGCVGLYFCTVFTRMSSVLLASLLALGGMAGFAYLMVTRAA